MSKPKYLEPICWVSRPRELAGKIGEGTDLCKACAQKRVEKYRAEFPKHAEDICVGGGNDYDHNSDGPSMCADCGEPLASYCMTSRKSVYTMAQWQKHP